MGETGLVIGTIAYFPNEKLFNQYLEFLESLPKWTGLICIVNKATVSQTEKIREVIGTRGNVLINKKNNVAAAWNLMIRYARRHRVLRLLITNTDVVYHPDAIKNCVDFLDENEDVFITGPRLCTRADWDEQIDDKNVWYCSFMINLATPEHGVMSLFDIWLQNDPYGFHFTDVKEYTGYFNALFDPAYYEDCDFAYRLKLAGMRSVSCKNALCYHVESQTAKLDSREEKKKLEYYPKNEQLYLKIWGGGLNYEAYKTPYGK